MRKPGCVRAMVAAGAVALTLATSTTPAQAEPLPKLETLLAVQDPGADDFVPADPYARRPVTPAPQATTNAAPTEDETPVYKRWWFWALTGAVVLGTVALGAWAAESGETAPAPCNLAICFGDGR